MPLNKIIRSTMRVLYKLPPISIDDTLYGHDATTTPTTTLTN